ncbi:beta-lactamase [Afipia sp. P52-10]|uniref:serine hydrolase domain-containing protein n=1 Tax=Afipia sp. P52-10 TaxID=1429916 RepID=UPI0003DF1591|nr:serine hydrolase domain-containing protein [Afipia sp. P52-10]ETR75595.1 beta-lactamase [Afipia sp. P52-10]
MPPRATAKNDAAPKKNGLQTPALPKGKPESLGFSSARLKNLSQTIGREVDKGTLPGAVVMIGRRGKVAHFDAIGRQGPDSDAKMRPDSVFRIFSMTKPIVSLGIMQLVEDGLILINDPLSKYIPAFAKMQVGVPREGKLHLVPAEREITIQDLLTHSGGLSYEITGPGPIQTLYAEAKLYRRNQTNEEHANTVASLPLISQPGTAWNYSRSTDILGRVIEVVSGKTLMAYLTERILGPLRMTDTGFHIDADRAEGRLAEPFPTDPWTGAKVVYFSMTDKPLFESGGGGMVSTAPDYARFAQMLANGGSLDRERIIGRKTLELMASNHLGPNVKVESHLMPPGHGFGLGFAVRTEAGLAPYPGSVGQYFWGGAAGTQFWVDPKENLWALLMVQAPGQREYIRVLFRNLVYAAIDS